MELQKIQELIDQGYISERTHPTLPLKIYNYTPKTQYEGYWNEITTQCRGLVIDDKDNIVARPIKKFFNYDQVKDQLPNEPFEVTTKEDGSLMIIFEYDNQLVFTSRGSFESEQALKAKEIYHKKYQEFKLNSGLTYLFEVIYPKNRIVLSYGDREALIMLGIIETATGAELPHDQLKLLWPDVVAKHNFSSINDLLSAPPVPNTEGYVVKYNSGFRFKLKQEEYVRLHKLITEASNVSIWECLKNNESLDSLLEKVPDEFYDFVKKTVAELKKQYKDIEIKVTSYAYQIKDEPIRKNVALWIAASVEPDLRSLVFCMLDGKDYGDKIWRLIRPTFERPFWNSQ